MKKRLLLAVLPALLALSGCKSLDFGNAEKADLFKEDTLAHEEIFGGAEEIGYFGKQTIMNRNPGQAITTPKIGYQIRYADSKLAIRFVAAINDLNVEAYWKRGVAAPDGTEVASFSNETQQVTKYYRTITDGPSTITAGEGEYAGYTGFVVYTLYNIPYSTVKDNYVAAYLSLVGDEDGEDDGNGGTYNVKANSVALAVSIERETEEAGETDLKNVFTFDPTVTGYFLEGTIGGVARDGSNNTNHALLRASESDVSFVDAVYNDVAFQASDSFGSFYYSPTSFKFFGNSTFGASDYFDAASLAEYSSPKADGTKTLYIFGSSAGAENHMRVKKEVRLYLTNNWSWNNLRVYVYNDAASTPKVAWPGETMTQVGLNDDADFMFNYEVDIGLYDRLKFSNNGYDETAPVDISASVNDDAYYLDSGSGNRAIKWGTYDGVTSYEIVYFSSQYNWEHVYYYAYGQAGEPPVEVKNANWPGKEAKWTGAYNEYSQKIYRLVVDTDSYSTIIFNNNSGTQTANIPLSKLTTESANAFWANTDGSYGTWTYDDPLLP